MVATDWVSSASWPGCVVVLPSESAPCILDSPIDVRHSIHPSAADMRRKDGGLHQTEDPLLQYPLDFLVSTGFSRKPEYGKRNTGDIPSLSANVLSSD